MIAGDINTVQHSVMKIRYIQNILSMSILTNRCVCLSFCVFPQPLPSCRQTSMSCPRSWTELASASWSTGPTPCGSCSLASRTTPCSRRWRYGSRRYTTTATAACRLEHLYLYLSFYIYLYLYPILWLFNERNLWSRLYVMAIPLYILYTLY